MCLVSLYKYISFEIGDLKRASGGVYDEIKQLSFSIKFKLEI